jgi:hypothetical protein
MLCTYAGSDTFQCRSTLRQVGYCAEEGLRDITAMSEWFTSNQAVAAFVSPGVLKVTGTGQVQVSSKYRFDLISDAYVYVVAPGTIPERLLQLSVIVRDAANADRRLVGATIQVEPDRGPSQSCLSSATGHCIFWVFDARIRIRAGMQGYDSADGVATKLPDSFTMHATLALQRMR